MTSLHANLVSVNGFGVLIVGKPCSGKSRLCYELLKRGHKLVADDLVLVKKKSQSKMLIGTCPKSGLGLMHLRGHGIIDVASVFGKKSIQQSARIDLVINLKLIIDVPKA